MGVWSARRHRRREFLHLFGEERAVGLFHDFGKSEVAHLQVGETLEAAPLELGLSVGGDHGVADREAVGAHGGDTADHVHLLELVIVLARQHADAGGVDAPVGLHWAADQQPIADFEVGQRQGRVALHDHGGGADVDHPITHGQRVPGYLHECADEGDALGIVPVLDADFTRGDGAVGVQGALDLHRRSEHEAGERGGSIVLPDGRRVRHGHLAAATVSTVPSMASTVPSNSVSVCSLRSMTLVPEMLSVRCRNSPGTTGAVAKLAFWPPPLNCRAAAPLGTSVRMKPPVASIVVAALLLGTWTRMFCDPLPIPVPWITPPPLEAGMPVGSLAEPHAAASSTSTSIPSDLVEVRRVTSA